MVMIKPQLFNIYIPVWNCYGILRAWLSRPRNETVISKFQKLQEKSHSSKKAVVIFTAAVYIKEIFLLYTQPSCTAPVQSSWLCTDAVNSFAIHRSCAQLQYN